MGGSGAASSTARMGAVRKLLTVCLCGGCCPGRLVSFVFDGGFAAQAGVDAAAVVEVFDPGGNPGVDLVAGGEGCAESFLLARGEPITRGAQKKPDLIEGIPLASAVTQGVLLDAAAYLIESVASELDDMEGVEDAGGVLELVVNGVLVSLEGVQRRDSHPCTEVFAALF